MNLYKKIYRSRAAVFILLASVSFVIFADDAQYAVDRAAMVAEIEEYARLNGDQAFAKRVMQSMASVQRHEFVPDAQKRFAYANRPLPIGFGQTISQPYIVALMTDLIEPDSDDVVLEIGTGSGYQAAILSGLVKSVYSIEIIKPLATQAAARLQLLGFDNVTTRLSDGYYGWAEHGPFDAIVVTAAASHVPPYLVRQLRRGGRMVIPVGGRFLTQQLLLIEKTETGEVKTRQVIPVIFVPLTGEH
ncbi:MAG: protein-L-isoaspartate(D-aspartate) O-methyltransferase [Proteobacteria bacterium]|nr:protein-L-isoaspartate(D-aspartate) O-methyltransferase [Pseudomonadota bacterium]